MNDFRRRFFFSTRGACLLKGKENLSLLLSGCVSGEENAPSLGNKATVVLSFLFCSTPASVLRRRRRLSSKKKKKKKSHPKDDREETARKGTFIQSHSALFAFSFSIKKERRAMKNETHTLYSRAPVVSTTHISVGLEAMFSLVFFRLCVSVVSCVK